MKEILLNSPSTDTVVNDVLIEDIGLMIRDVSTNVAIDTLLSVVQTVCLMSFLIMAFMFMKD